MVWERQGLTQYYIKIILDVSDERNEVVSCYFSPSEGCSLSVTLS